MAESRWIAFELHDGLMQWVIGARMHMAAVIAALRQDPESIGTREELDARLTQILTYLNQASEEGRHLIRFVEGLTADDGAVDVVETLGATAELLTRKAREGRPIIVFQRPAQPWPQLDPHFAWTVVRIVQQAAVNAVRHSEANLVQIILSKTDEGELCVSVTDDGKGFEPGSDYPGHFGLSSMRQRAREARLQLTIDSQSGGGGTRVNLRLPVPPSAA